MNGNATRKWSSKVKRFVTMNADTRQKWLARMQDLAGDVLLDVAKFAFCALVLTSLFDSMGKTVGAYAAFIAVAFLCFAAAAFFSKNKNNHNK
jgi:hypothetical protein